jgi:hypothetical protein
LSSLIHVCMSFIIGHTVEHIHFANGLILINRLATTYILILSSLYSFFPWLKPSVADALFVLLEQKRRREINIETFIIFYTLMIMAKVKCLGWKS